jgi:hypothetical protein
MSYNIVRKLKAFLQKGVFTFHNAYNKKPGRRSKKIKVVPELLTN